MITNIYWLNKRTLLIKFMIKYLRYLNYIMAYSETRIVIGGLAHVPVLIFIANFIKGKFGIKTKETKETKETKNNVVNEEPVKIIEVKNNAIKKGKAKAINEISNKLDSIERKVDEVYEKIMEKKKDKRRKKEYLN